MGSGFTALCTNCDFGEQYLLGVGMQYHSLINVITSVQGGARKKVLNIMKNHHVFDCQYEHRLYACPKCNTLHGRFYVHLEYDDGKIYEPAFRCGQCRTLLTFADEDHLEKYACKYCGKQSLIRDTEEMMWD